MLNKQRKYPKNSKGEQCSEDKVPIRSLQRNTSTRNLKSFPHATIALSSLDSFYFRRSRQHGSRNIVLDLRKEAPNIQYVNSSDLKLGHNIIHTQAVEEALSTFKGSIALGSWPPPIGNAELSLPRSTRSTLFQLRSGLSIYLNSYLTRLNQQVVDICPKCGENGHNTRHLFD